MPLTPVAGQHCQTIATPIAGFNSMDDIGEASVDSSEPDDEEEEEESSSRRRKWGEGGGEEEEQEKEREHQPL